VKFEAADNSEKTCAGRVWPMGRTQITGTLSPAPIEQTLERVRRQSPRGMRRMESRCGGERGARQADLGGGEQAANSTVTSSNWWASAVASSPRHIRPVGFTQIGRPAFKAGTPSGRPLRIVAIDPKRDNLALSARRIEWPRGGAAGCRGH